MVDVLLSDGGLWRVTVHWAVGGDVDVGVEVKVERKALLEAKADAVSAIEVPPPCVERRWSCCSNVQVLTRSERVKAAAP